MKLARLQIVDDHGPIGKGASQAHHVLADDWKEYLAKGPTYQPALPYVAACELIVGQLADVLGLPILPMAILERGSDMFFGSRWMAQGTYYPQISEPVFGLCEDKDYAYGMYVLDCWTLNKDRHTENLVVRQIPKRGQVPERHLILLNDHSHTLMTETNDPQGLAGAEGQQIDGSIRQDLSFVANHVTDANKLDAALQMAENVPKATIDAVVSNVPDPLLSPTDRLLALNFLCNRQAKLRTLVKAGAHCFPNLKGALP